MNPPGMKMRWVAAAAACVAVTGTSLGNAFRIDEQNTPPEPAPSAAPQPKNLTFSAERILAAKSMNELAALASGRMLQVMLADSVAAICREDIETAGRVVEHLDFLTIRQNKGEGWDFSQLGTNLPSYLLQVGAGFHPSPATLTLQWRYFVQNPDGHYAPTSWPRTCGWQEMMFKAMGDADGWADPVAGVKAMLGEATKITHEDAPGFFWQGSTALAMEIDPWDQLVMIHEAWKKCGNNSDPDVEAARILRASMQLQGHRFRRDIPREPNAGWERRSCGLVKILRSLATTGYAGPPACLAKPGADAAAQAKPFPPKLQFAIAASITRELAPLADAEIVEAGVDAGSAAMEKGDPTDDLGWELLLAAFNRLPVDERWRTVAWRFLNAYSKRDTSTVRWYGTIANSVDVAARFGDQRMLQTVLSRNIGCARTSRQFVSLVRAGHQEAAENWLKANLQSLQYRATEENVDGQAGDELAVENFCNALEKPEMKLLARLLVAVHPLAGENLPRTGLAEGTPRSEDWMARLAEEFAKTEFSDPKLRQVCLRLLADSPRASRILEETLAKESPSITEGLQAWHGAYSLYDLVAEPVAQARNEVAQGNPEAVRKLMQDIAAAAPLPEKRVAYGSTVFLALQRFSRGIAALVPYADAKETARWRDALCDVLSQEQTERRDEALPIALYQVVALHAQTQSMDRLQEWRASLPKAKQTRYALEARSWRGRLVPAIAALFRRDDDSLAPKEQRIQQLIDILHDPWISSATASQLDLLHEFCGARVFTAGEMVEAGAVLMKECPRGGRTARELAAMAWQTNQRAKAPEFLESARAAATDPVLQKRYAMGTQTLVP